MTDNPNLKIEPHTKYPPLMQKGVNTRPELRKLECWLIHLGGDAYLYVNEQNNYEVTKDISQAFKFAISHDNYKLTDRVMTTLKSRSGFGTPRRMRVVWERGKRLTPLNEVVE